MNMSDILQLKKETRRIFIEKRKNILPSYRASADAAVFEKTVSSAAYKNAKILLAYYPVKNEPDILPIVRHALSSGKRVAFPISNPDGFMLSFGFVKGLDELVTGAYSIPEPPERADRYINEPEALCIVPGLAFDREGKRIGYGKGYYDRFLRKFPGVTLGICYAEFFTDKLPVEDTDVPIDIIISEKEEIFTNVKKEQ